VPGPAGELTKDRLLWVTVLVPVEPATVVSGSDYRSSNDQP